MPLAYYSKAATADFWSEHWGGHTVDELLRIARTSPLTGIIERHLPTEGRLLEAGCGLGQYVLLLRERGHAAVGVDWSFDAVRQGSQAGASLAVMDLRAMGVRDCSVSAYLSLGVVEHDPKGPGGIVAEAARVLTTDGVLLLSVPYWNGVRRLFAPYIIWQNRRTHVAGGEFYQFAFTRREVEAFLEAHGFTVRSFHPYGPARILQKAVKKLMSRIDLRRSDRSGTSVIGPGSFHSGDPGRQAAGLKRALKRFLYTPPALRLFGHMILAVAVKR